MLKLNKNQKDKIIISVIFIAVICGFLLFMRAKNFAEQNKASIIEEKNQIETFLERTILRESLEELEKIEGSQSLINDLEKNKNLFDVNFEEVPGGVMVSFLGKGEGNTLHPYFGFFETKNDVVTKIHWSKNGKAKLINQNGNKIELKNTSDFAWNTEDEWENYVDLRIINLESENGNKYIMPGEVGVFTAKTSGEIAPKNTNHEYLIAID